MKTGKYDAQKHRLTDLNSNKTATRNKELWLWLGKGKTRHKQGKASAHTDLDSNDEQQEIWTANMNEPTKSKGITGLKYTGG